MTRPPIEGPRAGGPRCAAARWCSGGLLYVAFAWGFLQGLEYVGESFNWPQQVRQVALLALVIGLPIVLVVARYHGDRGEQRIRGTEVAIIALLFLLGGGIFWRYDRAGETAAAASGTAAVSSASPREKALAPDEKSIAVLPFADLSPAKDQSPTVSALRILAQGHWR